MISFEHNIDEFSRGLSDLARNQMPFAVSQALNDTATDVKEAWEMQMRRRLDRPTPFTMRGVYVRRATKTRLTAYVGIKTAQAKYLKFQQGGGVRTPSGRAIPVAVGQRRNTYGNMPRGALSRITRREDVFVGKVNGVGGVWKRPRRSGRGSKGLTLLVAWRDQATYRPNLELDRAAEGRARQSFPRHLGLRLRRAIATAR